MNCKKRPSVTLNGFALKASGLWAVLILIQLLFGAILVGEETNPETVILTTIRAGRYSDYSAVTFEFGSRFEFDKPVHQGNETRFRLKNVQTSLPAFRMYKISQIWVKLEKAENGLDVTVGILNNFTRLRYAVLSNPDRLAIKFYREGDAGLLLSEKTATAGDAHEKGPDRVEENLPTEARLDKDSQRSAMSPQENSRNQTLPAGSVSAGRQQSTTDMPPKENWLTLNFYKRDIREILSALGMQQQINVVMAKEVSGEVSVHLYRVSFDKALDSICRAGGFSYHKQGDVYFVYKPKVEPEPLAARQKMTIFKIEYADMDKIQEVLTAIPNIRMIKIHEPTKTIIVEDTPENIARVETLIRFWDAKPKQVLIEAKILEITLTDDMALGVDWEKVLGDVRIGTGGLSRAVLPATGPVSPVPALGSGIFANMITGAGTAHQFAAAIDALQEKTTIKTLSTPKILAIHSKQAKVVVGGQQGYAVTTVNQGISTETIQFIDTGTILDITPYVDIHNNVLLEVQPELTSATIEQGIPVTSSTKVTTWMMAKNGETVFIAGLIEDIKSETWTGVPCLGDIPGIRLLFGRTGNSINKKELIILITPQVLEDRTPQIQEAIDKTKEAEKDMRQKGEYQVQ